MARASSSTESDVATSKPPANTRAVILAFARVRGVFGVDEANDGVERIFEIGAAAFRNLDRRGKARSRGFGRGDRDRAQFRERRKQVGIDPVRHERGEKGGLLQFVDGLLDTIHQLLDDRAGVEAGCFVAGFEGDAVGLVLDQAGAGREASAVVRAARLQTRDMVGDGCGDIVRQSDLPQHDREQGAVDTFQTPDQIGLDLVANQPDRAPVA